MTAFEVRRVRPEDAAHLRAARLGALQDSPHAFSARLADEAAQPLAFWEDRARRGSGGAEACSFLGFSGGVCVAVVAAFRTGDAAELVSMWVAPDARRRGLGARLVEAVADWARASGIGAITLWVRRGNEDAVRFYERHGFARRGDYRTIPHGAGSDGLELVRASSGAPAR